MVIVLLLSWPIIGVMILITRALSAEHQMFCGVFDEVEKALAGFSRLEEVRRTARLVEGLLLSHAQVEEELLILAEQHLPTDPRRFSNCRTTETPPSDRCAAPRKSGDPPAQTRTCLPPARSAPTRRPPKPNSGCPPTAWTRSAACSPCWWPCCCPVLR